jgi:hypothetical protein
MEERRKSQRIGVRLDLCYKNKKLALEGLSFTDNISRDGMRFEARKGIKPGATLDLEIYLPGKISPIFGQAKVVWATESPKGMAEIGINIEQIDWHDRSRILEYLYQEWLKEISSEIKNIIALHFAEQTKQTKKRKKA